ncbi:MAG TPA: T9SS type A sorting domain-containing protein [Bacteroidia bacterium]|nr:T9SS type A sorting domain-containing protein [Bacteroidia bacterium]
MKTRPLLFIVVLIIAFQHQSFSQNCPVNLWALQPSGFCEKQPIFFITNMQMDDSCVWTYPNNQNYAFAYNDPFPQIPNPDINANGIFSCIIYRGNGCVDSAQIQITINPIPVVFITGPSFACYGETTYLTAFDASGNHGPYSYAWDNGLSSQSIPIEHLGGIYPHPSCYITNVYGCTEPNYSSYLIGTIFPPSSSITTSDLTEFCKGDSALLIGPSGFGFTYQWLRYGVPVLGETNMQLTSRKNGKYKLIVSDIFGCADTSDYVRITVHDKPIVNLVTPLGQQFCSGDSVLLQTTFDLNYNYIWLRNGLPVANNTNQIYVAQKGNYRVLVTNQFDCNRLSPKVFIDRISCRKENESFDYLVYPNPSSSSFNFQSRSAGHATLELYSISGQLMYQALINEFGEINFGNNLKAGLYFLKITSTDEFNTLLIKQH